MVDKYSRSKCVKLKFRDRKSDFVKLMCEYHELEVERLGMGRLEDSNCR